MTQRAMGSFYKLLPRTVRSAVRLAKRSDERMLTGFSEAYAEEG